MSKKPCPKCAEAGKDRLVYREGYENCWSHLPKSQRELARREKRLQNAEDYGLYMGSVSDGIKLLRLKTEQQKQIGKLAGVDITQELILARLLLADWFEKHRDMAELPLKDLMDVLNTISKIAKTAQTISEADEKGLTQEVMRAIINSISHAFHKANLHSTPEERAVVFATEIASVFGGEPDKEHSAALQTRDPRRPPVLDGEVQAVQ